MYNGEFEDEILRLESSCIILIDCKTIPNINCNYRECSIELGDRMIKIY